MKSRAKFRAHHRAKFWGTAYAAWKNSVWYPRNSYVSPEFYGIGSRVTERVEKDGGESECPIVSLKRGNHPEGPRGEKGTPCHDTVGGTHGGCIETLNRANNTTTGHKTGYVADFVPSRREFMT